MVAVIKGAILDVALSFWTALVAILALPFGFFPSTSKKVYKVWAKGALLMVKVIAGISYEIKGLEHIPINKPFVLLSKHQSMWETIAFLDIFENPSYILKKELLSIPFYGWYLKSMGMIAIDRSGGISSLKNMLNDAKQKLTRNHQVIIFPQGTRVPLNSTCADYPYYHSIVKLAPLGYPFFVAGLNSGKYWPKGLFSSKHRGKIIVSIVPTPLELSAAELKIFIEDKIENLSANL